MAELTAEDFTTFFQTLWHKPPFAWQRELARRVLEDPHMHWPEAIALPTAAGKTACMDIAVFALAAQAQRLDVRQPLTAPRRIFFVVDRRVIVDEAFERARYLAKRLQTAKEGIIKDVADRLRRLAGGDLPLAAYQLRGGMVRSESWAKSPTQPMIIASTVDQVGSRLLFRAYGPHRRMWPVHAGLVGNDSLILLDEAHCAQPFMQTLQAVKGYRDLAQAPLPSPFHLVVMSATPPEVKDVFRDLSNEGKDPTHPLGRRQLASKPTALIVAKRAKDALAKEMVARAQELVKQWDQSNADKPAVVLFCNRVDTARRVYSLLAKTEAKVSLLTGRMRQIDKDEIIGEELAMLSAEHSATRRLDRPHFVVATQTLEVGANLDFDLLVTECASLDALRQRFGRLNRMGRPISAQAAIVVRADQVDNSDDDPVYGGALASTWKWLSRQGDSIDFGIAALASRLPTNETLAELNAPLVSAPVLLPAHIDTLVQTSPVPWPSPDVALFLHGPESGPADVQVCWRADLPDDDESAWAEALIHCPPAAPECVSVPIGQMRRWLAGKASAAGSDVEGEGDSDRADDRDAPEAATRPVVRWRGRDDIEVIRAATDVRPGDVLVIPASLRGWEELTTIGDDLVPDWGDRAQAMMRGKALLRLHPEVLKQWPESEPLERLRALAETGPALLEEDPDALAEALRTALKDWSACLVEPRFNWLKSIVDSLANDAKLARGIAAHPTGGLILTGRHRLQLPQHELDGFSDEDDVASCGSFRSLLLEPMHDGKSHLDGVAEYAALHAFHCGLPDDLQKVLQAAGQAHDLGKADPRFQAWLHGGSPWTRGPLLAKSEFMAQGRAESHKARERAGYPQGGRHELLSVRLLESAPEALPQDPALRDLLLHLIESHHGHCRPFAPVVADSNPVKVEVSHSGRTYSASSATGLERLDAGAAERFWRLTRRYGWWGLAWLEAMLRLADHRRSEEEERQRKGAYHGRVFV